MMSVVIDSREPEVYRVLGDSVDVLDCDAVVLGEERSYALERKTIGDLFSSFYDGRLFENLKALASAREKGFTPLLVLEGNIGKFFKIRHKRVGDFLNILLVVSSFSIPIIYVLNLEQYALLISMLKSKAGRKPRSYVKPEFKKEYVDIVDERKHVLMSVRCVGERKAVKLLEAFGDLHTIFTSLDDVRLRDILGDKCFEHFVSVVKNSKQ